MARTPCSFVVLGLSEREKRLIEGCESRRRRRKPSCEGMSSGAGMKEAET